jgi:hypothetical protein
VVVSVSCEGTGPWNEDVFPVGTEKLGSTTAWISGNLVWGPLILQCNKSMMEYYSRLVDYGFLSLCFSFEEILGRLFSSWGESLLLDEQPPRVMVGVEFGRGAMD